jgi:Flp pilus assembly protein TadG
MRQTAPRDNRGQDLVEFALLLPALLLLLLGIVEFGMVIFAHNTVANAAREGARVGVIPSATVADMEQAVIDRTAGLNLTSANITATRTTTQSVVEVFYDHRLITALIVHAAGGDPQIRLRSVATMRTE